jgi:hypothetical protein
MLAARILIVLSGGVAQAFGTLAFGGTLGQTGALHPSVPAFLWQLAAALENGKRPVCPRISSSPHFVLLG